MKISKLVFGALLFAGLTILISIPAAELKNSFLGPMVSSCPTVFHYFANILSDPFSGSPVQEIWDCGIGFTLYLLIPGFGLSWIITKHIV